MFLEIQSHVNSGQKLVKGFWILGFESVHNSCCKLFRRWPPSHLQLGERWSCDVIRFTLCSRPLDSFEDGFHQMFRVWSLALMISQRLVAQWDPDLQSPLDISRHPLGCLGHERNGHCGQSSKISSGSGSGWLLQYPCFFSVLVLCRNNEVVRSVFKKTSQTAQARSRGFIFKYTNRLVCRRRRSSSRSRNMDVWHLGTDLQRGHSLFRFRQTSHRRNYICTVIDRKGGWLWRYLY